MYGRSTGSLGNDTGTDERLTSAGRVLPTVEVQVRGPDGEPGEIWVRGEQVSGEYAGRSAVVDADGWFPTRDRGWVDEGGYLFIEGRSDDTIIRGGENLVTFVGRLPYTDTGKLLRRVVQAEIVAATASTV